MLVVEGLSKAWPGFSLRVGLEIGDGRIAALLGPSGCGKSSLLRLLCGLATPDSGRILLDGRELSGLAPEARGIGLVFQDYALFPAMSVRRNIEYGPRMRGLGRADRERRARDLAASFGIADLLDRGPASLSGGEQQRVALARTLAAEPKLVLLDEPLSSLDAGLRRRLRSEIAERLRAAGVMALHVTHDVDEALAVADEVFLMDRGRIVERGGPEALYDSPSTAYGARFLCRGPVLPLLGLGGSPSSPLALTRIGAFRCRPIREGLEGKKLCLFFPSDAVRILGGEGCGSIGRGREIGENEVEGRVAESSYAGRCRRVRLTCPAASPPGGGGPEELEIEVPAEFRPAPGEALRFRAAPGDCMILPELE